MSGLALAKTKSSPLSEQKPEEFLKTETGSYHNPIQNPPKWTTLLGPATGLLHMLCPVLSPPQSGPPLPCQCKFSPSHYCLSWLDVHSFPGTCHTLR